jgi:hypothetical protein
MDIRKVIVSSLKGGRNIAGAWNDRGEDMMDKKPILSSVSGKSFLRLEKYTNALLLDNVEGKDGV